MLVSFAPRFAIYGDALCRELRRARPGLRVQVAPPTEAAEAAERLGPHLVVSDGPVRAPGAAKARISADPTEPSTMRLKGEVRRVVNPTFDDLLAFVDEVAGSVGGSR